MCKNTIIYSEKVIKDVYELAKELSDSIDNNSIKERAQWYLWPNAHIARMKKDILTNEQIRQNTQQGCRVLEIGSGMGTSCLIMKSLTDAEIIGVEPAPMSYHQLHTCIRDFKECNPHLKYESINAEGENIPYPDGYFDFIYSFEVLEHVRDPYKVLDEIYRLLKPCGCAYISTCNYDSFYEGHYKRFWNPFIGVEGNKKRYLKKGLSDQFLKELNFITKDKIIKWIKEIGFYSIVFNPRTEKLKSDERMIIQYPEGYDLSMSKGHKPVLLSRIIESKIVSRILSKYNREYKLYFLLTK